MTKLYMRIASLETEISYLKEQLAQSNAGSGGGPPSSPAGCSPAGSSSPPGSSSPDSSSSSSSSDSSSSGSSSS